MIRLVFIIASLNRGGAEKQLTLLVRGLDHSRFHATVVTIYDGGELQKELEGIENVELVSVHKAGRSDSVAAMVRLARLVRRARPTIVHGYLDTSNMLALLTGKIARAHVVWGVRSSKLEKHQMDTVSRIYRDVCAHLAVFADLIVTNSVSGRAYVAGLGYPPAKVVTIPNGFEVDRFTPDSAARARARQVWRVDDETPVIGLVARLDPIKDHPTFLRAAARLAHDRPDVRFVCVGGGSPEYGKRLQRLAAELSVDDKVIWAGETSDMPAAQNGIDIATLVSVSEGFPNAIGEAMACAVPCVVSNAGDLAEIVGDTGFVVPAGDPEALYLAWKSLLSESTMQRRELGRRARERILEHYSVASLVQRTTEALLSLEEKARDLPSTNTAGPATNKGN